MATVSSAPSWNPEDDLLLKNAVEAGASLEALAKGAVRFSRRFTIMELRERWHSLLYDPVTSAEACAQMMEFERSYPNSSSKSFRFGNPKECNGISWKRKSDSIRSQFYGMRKRMRSQDFSPFDPNFLGVSSGNEIGNSDGCEDEGMATDALVHFGSSCIGGGPPCELADVEKGLKEDESCGKMTGSVAVLGSEFSYHPDSLLNIPNEEEDQFMEVEGKDVTDKYDGVNSLLLSSPIDVSLDAASNNCEDQALDSNKIGDNTEDVCTTGIAETAELTCSVPDDQLTVSCSEVNMQLPTSLPTSHSPELHKGEMICILNSEDPDIPSNDDVFMPNRFASLISRPSSKETRSPGSLPAIQRNIEEIRLKKEEKPPQSATASQMLAPEILLVSIPNNQLLSDKIKNEVDSGCATPSFSRLAHGKLNSVPDVVLREEFGHTSMAVREQTPLHESASSYRTAVSGTEANPVIPNHEESDVSDVEGDIPSFSDIETMILEMDLCPNDQDSSLGKEVSRYQHMDAKKNIMRLEQCARSAMHRAIASQGAFAVLYGRHLKQYINKTEVILGRATEDVEVDIDLGREGRANKISRRQAVIRLEKDGSFVLKNVGKSSIFLNGREVCSGQLLSLGSNSLIEIKEMAFVFEMNHKSVMQYLTNNTRKGPGNPSFEWSPEKIPL